MNHEAQVIFLRRMAADIQKETMGVMGKGGSSPNTTSNDTLTAKIATWQKQLQLFNRNLQSRAGWVNHSFVAPSVQPSYAQKQSYKSRMNNITSLRDQALAVADSIVDLLEAMNGPGQAWKALAKSINKLAKGGEDLAISAPDQQELQEVIVQAAPGFGGPQGTGYTPSHTYFTDVITLCIALFILLTRKDKPGK